MPSEVLLEVCVETVASAIAAERGGAHRIELCSNLAVEGVTPNPALIEQVRRQVAIPLHVLIRPRAGDFHYTAIEFEVIRNEIRQAKHLGADGLVFGALDSSSLIDVSGTRELVKLARPLSVTFHRAFDMARDPYRALEDLIGLGVDRILTSGQEPSVIEGLDLIAELVQLAGDRVIIMPGGGTERNVGKVVARSGVREVHVTGTTSVQSAMHFRNQRVFMGGELRPPEYTRLTTDPEKISALRREAGAD
jgi:copper homeostasis protein